MNIFVLDSDPVTAAQQQFNKHVVKMPLESAQMLCSVLIRYGNEDTPYRESHRRHPCTLWAGDTRANFNWLVTHGIALCEEYTARYGKRHKSQDVIEWCATHAGVVPFGALTPHAQAMPEQYRSDCVITAYRDYYHGEKSHIADWKQNKPQWWRL